jgi:Xaa-Pro aminopeptidase
MEIVTGGDVVWESAFIFTFKNDEYQKTAIVGNFDADAEKNKGIWDKVIGYKKGISSSLKNFIGQVDPKNIALNYAQDDSSADGLTHGLYLNLCKYLAPFKDRFTSAKHIIHSVRGRKTPTEIELITKACELTEAINQKMMTIFQVGLSELDVQRKYHQEMTELKVIEAWQKKGCPSIDAGPDKTFGHVSPQPDIYLKKGHTLHNDFGIKFKGYCSDLQRMWFFGKSEEIPEELRQAFQTVHGAILKAANFIKPGVKGYEVDAIAREYVIEQGYEEFGHALGHQVGRRAHDGGTLLGPLWERYGDIPKGTVEKGNVFTLELFVTTENYGAVSLEEDIVVTDEGCRFLVPPQTQWYYLSV